MKITFLGTGTSQGVPVIACGCHVCSSPDPADARLRCSVLIELPDQNWVIDAGPDFRQQMLRARVQSLGTVLFTHLHKDHTGGFDDVRAFYFKSGAPTEVYLDDHTRELLHREYPYVFDGTNYPGLPKFNLHVFGGTTPLAVGGYRVQPIPARHHKLPVYGFRIGGFAYVTDANYLSPESLALLQGAEVVVLNALQYEPHISHYTVPEALALLAELKPRQGYLTHISHKLGRHAEVSPRLPQGVALAYDGLSFTLPDPPAA
ncbi:MAG: MBL fold metallo-hydrolase [Bacteroidia bacterium]|nr:MBL fold metallo-hydrolase [Bacteroidia bacterium]